MATIRNRITGETRQVPDEQLSTMGLKPKTNILKKAGGFVENNLPTIGAIGLPLAITALSGGTAAPATIPALLAAMGVAGAGAGTGYGIQQAIKQTRGEDVQSQAKNPLEGVKDYYGGMAKESATAAGGELVGQGIGKVAEKILGPVLSKIGISSPKGTVSNIGDEASKIYQQWGPQIKALTGDSIDITDLVKYLKGSSSELLSDPLSEPAGKFVSKKVLPSLTKGSKMTTTGLAESGEDLIKVTPEKARKTMSLLNKIKNYSPSTGQQKVTGDIATNVSQKSASQLNKLFKEDLKSRGLEDLLKNYETYGQAKGLENSLARPFDSGLGSLPTVLGALGFLTGNPLVGVGTTAGANLLSMPYTQLLLRQLIGKGVGATQLPIKALIDSLDNLNETK